MNMNRNMLLLHLASAQNLPNNFLFPLHRQSSLFEIKLQKYENINDEKRTYDKFG